MSRSGTDIDPRILGLLLAAQSTISVFSVRQKMVEFVCRAIEVNPGVGFCAVCIPGAKRPLLGGEPIPECADCDVPEGAIDHAPGLSCRLAGCTGLRVFPIRTQDRLFGFCLLKVIEPERYAPYEPFISNMIDGLAVNVERQWQKDSLRVANDELLKHRDYLQELVGMRTAELAAANESLRVDIAERKRAEEDAREIAAKLQVTFEGTPVGLSMVGMNKHFMKCNKAFCDFLGYSENELMQKTIADVTFPEDVNIGMADMQAIMKGEKNISNVQKRYLRKDGAVVWGEVNINLIRDREGLPQYWFPVILDITDRKRAQEKIYLNSMILHQLISSVSTADINGVIDYVNPAFVKLWGYESREQAIGQSVGSFFARPGDAGPVLEAIAKNGFWEGRFLAKRKDGTRFFCHGYASKLLDSKGKHIGYQSTNLDVTDIVKAEEHIRLNAERTETLLRLNQMTGSTLQQITDFALEEAVRLTGSTIGYLAFLNEDESVLTMHSWSKSAMAECAIVDKPIIYPVNTTGLWGDAVRQRRAVITNDYSAPVAGKKGYPKGHVTVSRHMNIPVFSGKRIVLVAGVGNKTEPYDERDVKQLTLLMEGMHNLLDRKRAEEALAESEQKYRLLFKGMMTGFALHEIITDAGGKPVDYRFLELNPAFEQLTGLKAADVVGRTVNEVLPDTDPFWIETYGKVALSGRNAHFERYFPPLDRTYDVVAYRPSEGRFAVLFTDVSERKRAEEALLLKNFVFDVSISANSIANIDGVIIEANNAFLRIWGFSGKEEVVGRPLPDFIQDKEEAVAIITALNTTGAWEGDYTAKRKDGSTFTARGLATVLRDKGEKLIGYQSAVIDITASKRNETALRESELYFRTLTESLPELVWTRKGDGQCDYLSQQWVDYTGIPAERQLGFGWLDQLHPDDRDRTVSAWNEAVQKNTDFNVEFRIRRHDGDYRWFKTRAVALRDGSGKPVKWFGSNTDIEDMKRIQAELEKHRAHLEELVSERTSELSRANEMLNDMGGTAKVGAWEFDTETMIQTWTEELFRIHEVDATYKPVVSEGINFYAPSARPQISQAVQLAIETGEPFDLELELITAKNHHRWVRAIGKALRENGKTRKVFGTFQDITERKTAENVIRQRTIELEATNRELESFSYSVSHDLRAPLRTIDGFSLALMEDYSGKVDETGMDHLRRVRAATLRMAQLIDDLLKLSRVSRGEVKIERADLGALARSVERELEMSEPTRKVDLAVGTDLVVDGDARLLHLAMENLLSNAWKFTGKHPKATVTVGKLEKDGETIFFVRDDGAGFDMAYVGKLFGPFQRLHSLEEFPGSGIGLATVQRIVHRHGGRIWAEGAVEKGATFWFTLNPKDKAATGKETDMTGRETEVTRRETDATRRETEATQRETVATGRETDATRRETGAAINEKEAALRKKDLSKKKKDAGDGK